MKKILILKITAAVLLLNFCFGFGCKRDNTPLTEESSTITIFTINDPHAQINNFSKIKYIVDEAESLGNVLVVSAGDLFSGNPVVDFTDEKGSPIIDLMNRCGFDVTVLGNHEFDYGQEVLSARIDQSEFDFICANADMTLSVVPQPEPYVTLSAGDIDVTFLGMIETSNTSGTWLPATHPLKLSGITFQPAGTVIGNYSDLKEETDADLLVLLSHLGRWRDNEIAQNNPFIDIIIGGHSHEIVDTAVNNIFIYQSGSYLRYLGKITLEISDHQVVSEDFELIDLDAYSNYDAETALLTDQYNNVPWLNEVIGYNEAFLYSGSSLGCFYTDALRSALGTDISFQNSGGLRANLDEGEITVREIYAIDPFNNGAHTYSMSVTQIKTFLSETGAGMHYSGVIISDDGSGGISIRDLEGTELAGTDVLTVGLNDFIPASYSNYFSNPVVDEKTTAELIIGYLRDNSTNINYDGCSRFYAYPKQ